ENKPATLQRHRRAEVVAYPWAHVSGPNFRDYPGEKIQSTWKISEHAHSSRRGHDPGENYQADEHDAHNQEPGRVDLARQRLFLVLPLFLVFDLLFALFLMVLMVLSMMIHDYSRELF